MKIRQLLKEAAGVTAAFAFGRFNPAHQGHIAVWQTVEKAGVKWYIGTNPGTLGPNDPLTFEQKSAWMEEIYPPIAGHIVPEQSVVTLAARIFKELGNKEDATIAYITDETDWAWSGKLLNQYNGVEGKHGYYKFAQIVHVPSPRVSSATALRDAARADDKVAFYHASGTDPKLRVNGKTYFDTVKEACAKYPLPVKKAKKTEGLEEGSDERSQNRLWAMITDYEQRAKATKNDIKKAHYMKMASELRGKLKTSDEQDIAEGVEQSYKVTYDIYGSNKEKPLYTKTRTVRASSEQEAINTLRKLVGGTNYRVEKQGVKEEKQRLDPKCWDGYKKQGTKMKGDTRVNNCVKESFTPMQIALMEGGHSLEEASLATMRDYFAGDTKAHDPLEITKQRLYYDPKAVANKRKEFKSQWEYDQWLKKHNLKVIGGSIKEDATDLNIGDPVIITGKGIEFEGTTGEIVGFGQDNRFVIVDLYNHGKHSFHSSDVSYNDYADSDEEEARMYDAGEFRDVEENDEKIGGRYDPEEFDAMVNRLKKIAKAGPMKTVWDPEKRVYKNVPDTDKQKKIAEAVVKVVEVIKQRKGLWKK